MGRPATQNADVHQALPAALYRAGRWHEAIAPLRANIANPGSSPVYADYFLAMANWRLGRQEEARAHLRAAGLQSDRELAASPPPPWNRRLTLQLLRREAEGSTRGGKTR
jgi:hypothetical protein